MDPTKPLVLVVDADANVRRGLTTQLHAAQYEVVEARNGREALDLASRFRPDLVLIDGATPLLDGFKVCQYIKADPQIRSSRVVVFTGSEREIRSAVEAGADDCLAKPVAKSDVIGKSRKVLGGTRQGAAPDGSNLRRELRRPVSAATVSWGAKTNGRFEVTYKERVIDISLRGLSFEHARCDVCTGYEKDTVHPQCPLFPFAKRMNGSHDLSFVVHLPDNRVIEISGRVAHVFQPPDWPRTEKIGVVFTQVSKEAAKAIREFLQAHQTIRAEARSSR
jgi:CheY-like chemotaxis protein